MMKHLAIWFYDVERLPGRLWRKIEDWWIKTQTRIHERYLCPSGRHMKWLYTKEGFSGTKCQWCQRVWDQQEQEVRL